MNFTLRDSRVDFINVSCWGKSAYIHDLADHFHIGDVGKSCPIFCLKCKNSLEARNLKIGYFEKSPVDYLHILSH